MDADGKIWHIRRQISVCEFNWCGLIEFNERSLVLGGGMHATESEPVFFTVAEGLKVFASHM